MFRKKKINKQSKIFAQSMVKALAEKQELTDKIALYEQDMVQYQQALGIAGMFFNLIIERMMKLGDDAPERYIRCLSQDDPELEFNPVIRKWEELAPADAYQEWCRGCIELLRKDDAKSLAQFYPNYAGPGQPYAHIASLGIGMVNKARPLVRLLDMTERSMGLDIRSLYLLTEQ